MTNSARLDIGNGQSSVTKNQAYESPSLTYDPLPTPPQQGGLWYLGVEMKSIVADNEQVLMNP